METLILAGIASARGLITYFVKMASLAGPDQISPEALEAILAAAERSDSAWDDAVAAARARIGG